MATTGKTESLSATPSHRWKFFRAGGFDQVRLRSGADIAALPGLDQKLWMALGCPATGVEFDERTLKLLDSDKDGRIRVTEVIGAIEWVNKCLLSLDPLVTGGDAVLLSSINSQTDEGKQVMASARRILSNLGKAQSDRIVLEDVSDTSKILSHTRLNGDGVIPAEAVDDKLAGVISDIMASVGSETDRAGKPGVSASLVEAFFAELSAFVGWLDQTKNDASILALGADTAAANAAFSAVEAKLEDYFTRCALSAFEGRAGERLRPSDETYQALASATLSAASEQVAALPISALNTSSVLDLTGALNPAWVSRVQEFALRCQPLLEGRKQLSASDVATLAAKFAPYRAWSAAQGGAKVAALGEARARELLAGPYRADLDKLIAEDKALEPEIANIEQVEKLIRYQRDLFSLLNNFVAFTDFYQRRGKAIFQAGTLYLDQRSCDLCIRVEDAGKHAGLAALSRMYLAYCDVTRRGSNEKMTIVAAFTNGDADNLMVGRNGVFYDRSGRDWDATIVKIVDNPISIRQAFFAPYKKFLALIEAQVAKFAASKDSAVESAATQGIAASAQAVEAPAKAAPAPFDVAKFAGIFAAIGLAIGAITGAISSLVSSFVQLQWWQMPLALAGMLLVVSGPSMLIAWLKLRQRNLGPILDANGWAVNSQAKVNLPLGEALTEIASLPAGADVDTFDAFAEKHPARKWILLAVLTLIAGYAGWHFGYVAEYVSDKLPKPHWLVEKEAKVAAEKAAAEKAAAEKTASEKAAAEKAAAEKAAAEKAAAEKAQRSENAPSPSGTPTAMPIPAPATAPFKAENKVEAKKPLAEPINAPAAVPSATPAAK